MALHTSYSSAGQTIMLSLPRGQSDVLLDRQGVQLGADEEDRSGAMLQQRDDACLPISAMIRFLPSRFRMVCFPPSLRPTRVTPSLQHFTMSIGS